MAELSEGLKRLSTRIAELANEGSELRFPSARVVGMSGGAGL